MYKLCDTALKLRLVALDVGNYAVGLRARFALSHAISTNQHNSLNRNFLYDITKTKSGIYTRLPIGNYNSRLVTFLTPQIIRQNAQKLLFVHFIQLLSASSGDADDI